MMKNGRKMTERPICGVENDKLGEEGGGLHVRNVKDLDKLEQRNNDIEGNFGAVVGTDDQLARVEFIFIEILKFVVPGCIICGSEVVVCKSEE